MWALICMPLRSGIPAEIALPPGLGLCYPFVDDDDPRVEWSWYFIHFGSGTVELNTQFPSNPDLGARYFLVEPWLAQGNYIFTRLQTTDYNQYAYWSLDAAGVDRLSAEEAKGLGFPSIQLNTTMELFIGDAKLFGSLRQLHEAKGFDPDSQDIARHLNLRLFQMCYEAHHLMFADAEESEYSQGENSDDEEVEISTNEDVDELTDGGTPEASNFDDKELKVSTYEEVEESIFGQDGCIC
ncbi:hypothetical protein C8R43DRAFT_1109223 [Mycena crocata]|nr:hypothetical protein C8R43DRAFT_1109223 [Mycena crocata]